MAAGGAKVLDVAQVGIDDDFFALGGHSHARHAAVRQLRSVAGIEISLRQLYASRPSPRSWSSVPVRRRVWPRAGQVRGCPTHRRATPVSSPRAATATRITTPAHSLGRRSASAAGAGPARSGAAAGAPRCPAAAAWRGRRARIAQYMAGRTRCRSISSTLRRGRSAGRDRPGRGNSRVSSVSRRPDILVALFDLGASRPGRL